MDTQALSTNAGHQPPAVSVIVPVYNGERYLRQCIDSILQQTLQSIEVIVVDDGSSDDSLTILADYENRDSRLKMFRQSHGYAGAARNLGMRHAAGKYLAFWDCDDYFEPNALEQLFSIAERDDADIVVCGANQFYEELGESFPTDIYVRTKRLPEASPFNRKTNPDHILDFTNEAAWNKLFRRSFIEREGLSFQPIRNGNDVFFVVCALSLAERISTTTERLVTYRKNQKSSLVGSLSQSNSSPFFAWMDSAKFLQDRDSFPAQSFANKALSSLIYLLRNMQDREAFCKAVTLLKGSGLQTLGLLGHDPDYFYVDWQYDVVRHIQEDSPEDFLMYLSHLTYIQLTEKGARNQRLKFKNRDLRQKLTETKAKLKKAEQETARIKQSRCYRLANSLRSLLRGKK
ncbi:MAG: glycosyltransferase [Eggerthellaceae bacterium]|nr:glycosyltransferase [Eggerthellaceae bacterium]